MKKRWAAFLTAAVLAAVLFPARSWAVELPVEAQAALLMEKTTGQVLYAKNEHEQLEPASVTKLLSILTALEYVTPETVIAPGDELALVTPDASIAYITREHQLTASMLIEGMLLPSGNDAALALAAAAGRAACGDDSLSGAAAVEVFAEKMNERAAALGMTGSHFTNPDGYRSEGHYSTVEDMARLAAAAWDCAEIRQYCGLPYDDVTYASGHTNHWVNTNLMLDETSAWYRACVTGIKTGSLSGAYCLVCSIEKDGHTWLAGVFTGADNDARYGDMAAIVDWLTAE